MSTSVTFSLSVASGVFLCLALFEFQHFYVYIYIYRQSYVLYSPLYHAGSYSHPLRQYKNMIYFQEIKWKKQFQIQNYLFSENFYTRRFDLKKPSSVVLHIYIYIYICTHIFNKKLRLSLSTESFLIFLLFSLLYFYGNQVLYFYCNQVES